MSHSPDRCARRCASSASLHRGVDHQQADDRSVGGHQVVANAARIIGEDSVALPPGLQPRMSTGTRAFESPRSIFQLPGLGP